VAEARPISSLPSALVDFDGLWRALGQSTPVVLLDYDGTLTPIVRRPEIATLGPGTRAVVERLSRSAPVVVVSGRDRDNVAEMVGLPGLWYAGSHGSEISAPDGRRFDDHSAEVHSAELAAAQNGLERLAERFPGAHVERKSSSLALHYREVEPESVRDLLEAFDVVEAAHPDLRRSGGKMVVELRAGEASDKGVAVRRILDDLLDDGHGLPLYVGDDLTDEDAFATIAGHGAGVVVEGGDHDTVAGWAVADADDVRRLLERLADRIEGA
jgi:trehalose 6-phosphate phosphatase